MESFVDSNTFCHGESKIKLKLRIIKKENKKNHYNTKFRFVVIDVNRSKHYPENFVCILPLSIKIKTKPTNKFEKEFGAESIKIAKLLLKKALRSRVNIETKKAIKKRLKLLKPIMNS